MLDHSDGTLQGILVSGTIQIQVACFNDDPSSPLGFAGPDSHTLNLESVCVVHLGWLGIFRHETRELVPEPVWTADGNALIVCEDVVKAPFGWPHAPNTAAFMWVILESTLLHVLPISSGFTSQDIGFR